MSEVKHKIWRDYKLSKKEYLAIVESQEGNCAICRVYYGEKLVIDHDHFSDEVRGLLCRSCNLGLGCFKDNPYIIKSSIKYLNRVIVRHEEN